MNSCMNMNVASAYIWFQYVSLPHWQCLTSMDRYSASPKLFQQVSINNPVLTPVIPPVITPVITPVLTPVLTALLAALLTPVLTPLLTPLLTPRSHNRPTSPNTSRNTVFEGSDQIRDT